MFCGTASFAHVDEELGAASPRHCSSSRRADKNPYSAMGLEKFSAVLAELEAKRETIMKRIGSQGVAGVRFTYTDTNWVPIIVKQLPREEKQPGKKSRPPPSRQRSELNRKEAEKVVEVSPVQPRKPAGDGGPCKGATAGRPGRWPTHYWLLMAMILVCLALSGRTFAICCASVCWYAMPEAARRNAGGRMTPNRRAAVRDRRIGSGNRWWRRSY